MRCFPKNRWTFPAWLIATGVALTPVAVAGEFPARPPADVTSVMDRDQMMTQLGMSFPLLPPATEDLHRPAHARLSDPANPNGNWTDDAGNVIVRSGFGLWVTYDDEQVYSYPPIDLLQMDDGTPVTTPEQWWNRRRPELFEALQRDLYGRMPDPSRWPAVAWSAETNASEGAPRAYVEKVLTGVVDTASHPQVRDVPRIVATLRVPAGATGAVPVIVVLGTRGIDELWQLVGAEGWALCMFDPNLLQPDHGAGLTSFLIGLVNQGNWRQPDDWGSLVAIAWGIGRLLDHFETLGEIDASRVALAGHSRWGKATAVAMAYEPRIAVSYPSCGGALGPSMIRRHWGQNLENLAWDREYHWCAGNIFQWMGPLYEGQYLPRRVQLLTVDAHALVAMAAPRPVFLNGGTTDTWSDAPGTWLTGVAASPVYELLGHQGLVTGGDPEPVPDKDYLEGDLGYRVHTGGHTPMPDWPAFITFARKYLNASSK
jgi:hypothetical protein